eukprot:2131114-Pleurochrysis_carterae.AAC.1
MNAPAPRTRTHACRHAHAHAPTHTHAHMHMHAPAAATQPVGHGEAVGVPPASRQAERTRVPKGHAAQRR